MRGLAQALGSISPLVCPASPEDAARSLSGCEEIVAYWPALIPKEEITPAIEVLEA